MENRDDRRSRSRSTSPVNKKPKIEEGAKQNKQYRGVRMRKGGNWVAEMRLPKNRTRIWLGSYMTPVAAARAYDTAVFSLWGQSGRLNFPELLFQDQDNKKDEGDMSIDSIRKRAIQVGEREDDIQTLLNHASSSSNHNSSTTPFLLRKPDDLNEFSKPDDEKDDVIVLE